MLRLTCPASKADECAPPDDHVDQPMETWLLARSRGARGRSHSRTCRLVLESNRILENHPVNVERACRGLQSVNYCWPSIGRRRAWKIFHDKFGVSGAVIGAVDLIRGIGATAGMDCPTSRQPVYGIQISRARPMPPSKCSSLTILFTSMWKRPMRRA